MPPFFHYTCGVFNYNRIQWVMKYDNIALCRGFKLYLKLRDKSSVNEILMLKAGFALYLRYIKSSKHKGGQSSRYSIDRIDELK